MYIAYAVIHLTVSRNNISTSAINYASNGAHCKQLNVYICVFILLYFRMFKGILLLCTAKLLFSGANIALLNGNKGCNTAYDNALLNCLRLPMFIFVVIGAPITHTRSSPNKDINISTSAINYASNGAHCKQRNVAFNKTHSHKINKSLFSNAKRHYSSRRVLDPVDLQPLCMCLCQLLVYILVLCTDSTFRYALYYELKERSISFILISMWCTALS